MQIPCPNCANPVFETAPACPTCGTHVYIEHPGDIPGVKHPPLDQPPTRLLGQAVDLLAALTLAK